ncbi:RNA pseudouridine synthase [Pseudoduganella plicata]|uniref:Dual-specificity RNA pseudouridine synthase RluF n=1 Tax=Pseudoduganella plicata TaxID=321984 RepID=A0A4P7BBS4_9BURK|nr:RNA pseudouridine synthase [Pseudoduganella plicata]QBQ36076.1 RNA-binding protein [Pseudoduganella plicata]GGY78278.1 RNA-binding protein S4 [Pseudoduganella plicata]
MTDENTIRLSKRVADMLPCSRREAELYIEGGFVLVDGAVVEEAGARVAAEQAVTLAPDATLLEIEPVTIMLNKPAGADPLACLTPEARNAQARKERFLKRHLHNLTPALPLDNDASGLFVFTQDYRIARKLVEEGARMEQEIIVDVRGRIVEDGLAQLNGGATKVSWQNEQRLRFAMKGPKPSQIEKMCKAVGLTPVALKRLRIGRMSMGGLAVGEWRYLQGFERF